MMVAGRGEETADDNHRKQTKKKQHNGNGNGKGMETEANHAT